MKEFIVRYYFDKEENVPERLEARDISEAVTMIEEQLQRTSFSFDTLDALLRPLPDEQTVVYSANVRFCRVTSSETAERDTPSSPAGDSVIIQREDLAPPAYNAIRAAGITTFDQLARWSESDLLRLPGSDPDLVPALRASLQRRGLDLRHEDASAPPSTGPDTIG